MDLSPRDEDGLALMGPGFPTLARVLLAEPEQDTDFLPGGRGILLILRSLGLSDQEVCRSLRIWALGRGTDQLLATLSGEYSWLLNPFLPPAGIQRLSLRARKYHY